LSPSVKKVTGTSTAKESPKVSKEAPKEKVGGAS